MAAGPSVNFRPILMPKLGLTMTEGLLAEWKVAPGDAVKAGDVIFVVETDKISNEIEASEDGTIGELLTAPGETVPVGTTVATMAVEDVDPPRNGEVAARSADGGVETSPRAQMLEDGTRPLHHAASRRGPPPRSGEDLDAPRLIVTPLARRVAAKAGVDLTAIAGSGPRGRIMADDVEAARDGGGTRPAPAPARTPPADELITLNPHRAVVARRLAEAKRDIPHFYVFAEADVTELTAMRKGLNADPGAPSLTVSHLLIAALARALVRMPEMNCVWAGDALRRLPTIDVGVAVEGPKGLVAPVLHDLAGKSLDEIGEAATILVERARAGRLGPDDLAGGALSLSNVGMFGATGLVPIVNPGQSSILGVGRAQPLFRPDEHGQPVLRQILGLSLSCDHRVIDGALAARFLQILQTILETPFTLVRRPRQEQTR